MRNLLVFSAVAAALAWSAHAQTPPGSGETGPGAKPPEQPSAAPPASSRPDPGSSSAASQPAPDTGAATGSHANTAAAAQDLAVGLSVKDNTGAAIGQVTDLKTDA